MDCLITVLLSPDAVLMALEVEKQLWCGGLHNYNACLPCCRSYGSGGRRINFMRLIARLQCFDLLCRRSYGSGDIKQRWWGDYPVTMLVSSVAVLMALEIENKFNEVDRMITILRSLLSPFLCSWDTNSCDGVNRLISVLRSSAAVYVFRNRWKSDEFLS